MHIKRFEAATLEDALARVKEELGPDALILGSRTLRRGRDRFGLLSRNVVEVQAAKERLGEEVMTPDFTRRYGPNASPPEDAGRAPSRARNGAAVDIAVGGASAGSAFEVEIRDELRALHRELASLSAKQELARERSWGRGEIQLSLDNDEDCPTLRRAGIDESIRAMLAARWREELALDPSRQLVDVFRARVESSCAPLRPRAGGIRVAVGAPGVGKTTTLAKLAARSEEGEREIAMVSLDHYRVGGPEQLRRYAEMMESPFLEAHDLSEICTLARRMPDHEILVDTAGRGREAGNEILSVEPLRAAFGKELQVELVIDATSRPTVQQAHLARFAHLTPDRLIVTKMDECEDVAPLLNLLLDPAMPPIGWQGTGQRVPEDLDPIDPAGLVQKVLGVAA